MEIKDYRFDYLYIYNYGDKKKRRWFANILIDLGGDEGVISVGLYKEELEKLIESLQNISKEMPTEEK